MASPLWDMQTFARYQALIALRTSSPALRAGGLRFIHVGDDVIVYIRETASERLMLAARASVMTGVTLPGRRPAVNIYGGAADLCPGDELISGGPTFQVWRIDHDGK